MGTNEEELKKLHDAMAGLQALKEASETIGSLFIPPIDESKSQSKDDEGAERLKSDLQKFTDRLSEAVKSIEDLENKVRRNDEIITMKTDALDKAQSNMNTLVIGVLVVAVVTLGGIYWEIRMEKANNTRIEKVEQKQENLDGDVDKLETRVEKYIDRFLERESDK